MRDLAVNPVPHLDSNLLGGWMKPAEQRNDSEQASLDRSNQLTDELLAADVLVMAAPMYNFAIPSTLKAWLDHVLRAGVTFKYTETGPQGLLSGKRAYVLTARGGIYAGGPADHQEPYLRQVMGFHRHPRRDLHPRRRHEPGRRLPGEGPESGQRQTVPGRLIC